MDTKESRQLHIKEEDVSKLKVLLEWLDNYQLYPYCDIAEELLNRYFDDTFLGLINES